MLRLTMILFSMISTAFMGSAIIISLTLGGDTLVPILAVAAIGFVIAIPVSWYVARQLA
jgi:hypothetical protein